MPEDAVKYALFASPFMGKMMKKKKKQTQLDLIKSVRREMPPNGQTFQVKKKKPFRKRKHKGKIDSDGE